MWDGARRGIGCEHFMGIISVVTRRMSARAGKFISSVLSAVTGSPSDDRILLRFATSTIIWSVGVCSVLALCCLR